MVDNLLIVGRTTLFTPVDINLQQPVRFSPCTYPPIFLVGLQKWTYFALSDVSCIRGSIERSSLRQSGLAQVFKTIRCSNFRYFCIDSCVVHSMDFGH